ncbi:MAG: hypothetical protein A2W04_09130 [Betaproteobacteria bacterium RBG_16_64_9]|nr:MAG: hypothetical protein A2W04_09130 [Betaproteobacteria bacterium RBG_16_64_9]OGA24607.1 MAG: hypothetical protein A3I01_06250 [Betaproteobacteria bacterium RIFCSPLOWO2_02_FULL_65_24]OGA72775.1 MAG: hypothetical protein A3G27_11645 [Betaproteobacteria bacterium RIFCSPLOWO2_12_FULL_66_14]
MIRTPLKAAVIGAIALGLATPIAYAQMNPCSPKGANPCAAAKKDNPCSPSAAKAAAKSGAKNPCAAKAGTKSGSKNPCAANPCAAKNPCAANKAR